MTDLATLAIKIDSSDVKSGAQELDALTVAGGKAEKSSKDLAAAWTKADVSMSALGKATAEAKAEMAGYAAALKSGAIGQAEYESSILKTKAALSSFQADHRSAIAEYERARNGMDGVTASAGAQRAGMQQLGMQIGDAATMFSMGANASQVFASQLGQATGAVQLMLGSTSRLGAFLSGPWGMVITTAAVVLVPFIAKLFESGDAADTAAQKYANAAEAARQYVGAANAAKLVGGYQKRGALQQEQFDLEQLVQRNKYAADPNMPWYSPQQKLGSAARRLQAVRQELLGLTNEINIAEDANRRAEAAAEKAAAAAARHAQVRTRHTGSVRESNSAMSEAKRYAEALAKSEEALAVAALRSAYAFDQKMRALDGNNSLAPGIMGFKPAEQLTVAERLARDNAEAMSQLPDLTADWNKELDGALDRLHRIGGIGGDIAGWVAALTKGNFTQLGGAAGALAQTILGIQTGGTVTGSDGKSRNEVLGDRIERIFTGKDGAFGKTMSQILQGAGTGVAIGSALFGQSNGGAQIGGAIGGAIGGVFSKDLAKTIGGTLGNVAGALLPVVGGVLGGLIGSIFGKKPKGGGTVSNAGVNTWANDGAMKAGLDSFGLGIQQSVSKIADQLGGTVGNYSVGIGGYKGGYYQVSRNANDPYLGQSNYNKKSGAAVYDGLDAAAALRAAISVAIEQGAIQGVRAGVSALLKKGTDIEAQLAKAIKFQGVFDDLRQATDPIGYALDQITRKFDGLRKIFDEAGATAADYADLEKLLTIQRADALQQARTDIVNKVQDPLNLQIRIMELLGESEKAVTAQRMLELAGLKDSLQPLQAMVYTLEDARAVIDKFTPLRDDLAKFKNELLGGQAGTSFGFLSSQFRSAASAAAGGDATAMGQLRGAANDYLEAAKNNARTVQEYNAARAEVLAATDRAIFAADSQIDYQQAVIDSAKANGALLADMKANLASLSSQIVTTSATVAAILKRWDGGDSGAPLPVQVVA